MHGSFSCGHDTTAAGLIWCLSLLSKHPEIRIKVSEELVRVLGEKTAEHSHLSKLVYLRQVIKEALRLYPPAIGTFAREASERIKIGGFDIPKGSYLYTFSYATHRDPRFFPDPLKFDPDRFSPEREEEIPAFAYFPFGAGPRSCIGMSFSMMEMTLVLATILQNGVFESQDLDLEPEVSMSLRPKNRVKLRFTKI